jgi:uronate dehydrogenase
VAANRDDGGPAMDEVLLVTGAAGSVGSALRPLLRRPGRTLRLADVAALHGVAARDDPAGGEEALRADITDPQAMRRACAGAAAVLHLAGIASEAGFADVLRVNVAGTHTVLDAAVHAGVRRVVLASSNHAAGFYRRADAPTGPDGRPGDLPGDLPPRPDTYYGWSKAAVESLGALYHHRYGIDVVALRIGTCEATPPHTRALATWLAPADAARLVEACLSAPEVGFRVVWGVSGNTRRWWSLAGAERLGYRPVEDAERYAGELVARHGEPDPADPVHDRVGGPFCTAPLGEPMG